MLKGIPNIISPELLKILDEMGHGDEIVIGDGNFPAASNAQRLHTANLAQQTDTQTNNRVKNHKNTSCIKKEHTSLSL